MTNSLISVIVPVYKCEKYLKKCVGSILSQSYSNLEVLLIDDGSPDGSPAICDSFAAADKRVKVFHKENGGASSARNVGLENATGDYVCFVDSDDLVPENSVLDLFQSITKNACQYAEGICGILGRSTVKKTIEKEKIISWAENPKELLCYLTQIGSYSPYSKIYDAKIIREHNLRFDESLKCSEDTLFIRQYLSHCSRMVLIPTVVYEYNTENEASLSKRFYSDFCHYYVKKLEALEALVEGLPLSKEEKSNFIFDRAVHGLYISTYHYVFNCRDKKQAVLLIGTAIKALKKWTDIEGESVSHAKWWSKNKQAAKKGDAEKIYATFRKKYKTEKAIQIIKKPLKKIIRGIFK